jgi:hypothetical protein
MAGMHGISHLCHAKGRCILSDHWNPMAASTVGMLHGIFQHVFGAGNAAVQAVQLKNEIFAIIQG